MDAKSKTDFTSVQAAAMPRSIKILKDFSADTGH
jgi:hypothetical protein